MKKTVVVSGYFNPVHQGHIKMFQKASKYGKVIVILNNDKQVKIKGSVPFMKQSERKVILESIKYINKVIISIDKDGSVCKTLELIKPDYFANGGDRKAGNIPEYDLCKRLNIKMLFNIGGRKTQSSSKLIKQCQKIQ